MNEEYLLSNINIYVIYKYQIKNIINTH